MILRLLLAGLILGSAWQAKAQQLIAIGFRGDAASIDPHVLNATRAQ